MQCSDCREDFLSTIPALAEDFARPGDVAAALPPLLQRRKRRGAELLRRRGGGRPGLRLAVHLPLLPQPGRSRALRRRPGLPRLDRRRRRGTERAGMGGRPGRQRRPRRRHLQAPRRLRGTRPRPRHPRPPGRDRQRPQRHRNAPGRPVAGSDRTGDRSSAVIGAPGFEPGTSPTRTVRATRLRHAPRAAIISERRLERRSGPARRGRYFAPRPCSSKAMTRKITLILALALAAIAPSAAHAYLPQGFIGVSPQSPANSADFELMREARASSSVRLPLYWIAVQPQSPDSSPKPDWCGFDHEVELAAEAGIRIMPFVWRLAGMGRRRSRSTCRCSSAWQRWGWTELPARSGRTLRAGRLLLGRTPGAAVPADPPLGDLERGEHRHLRRPSRPGRLRDPDPHLRPRSCTAPTPAPR